MDTQNQLEQLKKLREPFPASAISQLPKGNTALDFVGHANITDRLLNVDPFWSWEPLALDERGLPAIDYDANGYPVGLWIKLTVCGVTRIGYGSCVAKKNEAVKELIGDALRNAAMRFGAALELWSKAELESQHDENAPQQSTQPQRRPAAQQPPRPQNNGNGQKHQKSPMDLLVEHCNEKNIFGEPAHHQHVFNILKQHGIGAVKADNLKECYQAIVDHQAAKNAPADEAALDAQRGEQLLIEAEQSGYSPD